MARNARMVRKSVVQDVSESIGEDVLAHVEDVAVVDDSSTEVKAEVTFPTTEELIAQGLTTKSSRIRKLHSLGMKVGAIAKQETNGLYQHAYNVIHKELKKGPRVSEETVKAGEDAGVEAEAISEQEVVAETSEG